MTERKKRPGRPSTCSWRSATAWGALLASRGGCAARVLEDLAALAGSATRHRVLRRRVERWAAADTDVAILLAAAKALGRRLAAGERPFPLMSALSTIYARADRADAAGPGSMEDARLRSEIHRLGFDTGALREVVDDAG